MVHTTNFLPPSSVSPTTAMQRRLPWWSALGLCGFCSCAAIGQPAVQDPFNTTPSVEAAPVSRPTETPVASPDGRATVGRARIESTPIAQAPQMPVAQRAAQPVRRPGMSSNPNSQNIRLASDSVVQASRTDGAIQPVAAMARTPAVCPDGYGFAAGPVYDDEAASPALFPDEYL